MPELLTYQWSPATAYAAVNSIAELNQKRSQQAQSMALQLAELAQKHDEEAARAAEAAKKLDYDQQHQMRVDAIAGTRAGTSASAQALRQSQFNSGNQVLPDLPTQSASVSQGILTTPDLTGSPEAPAPAPDNSWMDFQPVSRAPVAVDQPAADAQAFQDSRQTPAQRSQAEALMAMPVKGGGGPTSLDLTGSEIAGGADYTQDPRYRRVYSELQRTGVPAQKAAPILAQTMRQLQGSDLAAQAAQMKEKAKPSALASKTLPDGSIVMGANQYVADANGKYSAVAKPGKDKDTEAEVNRLGFVYDKEAGAFRAKDNSLWLFGTHGKYQVKGTAAGGKVKPPTVSEASWMGGMGGIVDGLQGMQDIMNKGGLHFTSTWNGADSDFQKAVDDKKITRGEAELANHWLTPFRKENGKPAGMSNDDYEKLLLRTYANGISRNRRLNEKGLNFESFVPTDVSDKVLADKAQREKASGLAAPATAAPVAAPAPATPPTASERIATNPKTGEKVVFRNGKWIPLQ